MERLKARPSLSHLADKFNTAPPPNYVAGRGRGVSGFSKPSAEDLHKGRGAGASSAEAAVPEVDSAALQIGSDGKLEGDAGDSRALDLSETELFEKQDLSMNSKEAGYEMEAFNMNNERKEGEFDQDFNYVWKRKGDDPDDVHDAWLGEVDASGETVEKVEKRRRLLQKQIETQQQPDEPAINVSGLLQSIVAVVQPTETVAAALRRLSSHGGKPRSQTQVGKRKMPAADAAGSGEGDNGGGLDDVLRKQQFEQLTEAADALLRAGRFDIYSQKREDLLDQQRRMHSSGSQGTPAQGDEKGTEQATALGINPQVHAGAIAGGFELNAAHRVYYNQSSGLYFDPQSSLYWSASSGDADSITYYAWDAASSQFVVASNSAASASNTEPSA